MRRRVIHKPLDADCLLDGELHPSIRLRLERIRELPMTAVANLHGVEVIDGRAVMVWEFVAGRTLEDELSSTNAATLEKLQRDLSLVVEQLHGFGIVHGALHARNVIVSESGRLRLTHLSPLLHNDPEVDRAAVEAIFVEATRGHLPLRGNPRSTRSVDVATRRLDAARQRDAGVASTERTAIRSRAFAGAIAAAIFGVVLAASIIWYASTHP